ncbi:hypothetical protein ACIBO2_53890 [Nonomuraea sp. NPDC050022]|uniref:hypothetical protein n=1 Tax=unclassified Nonomuraea TaxID=2593643 RepID=UPI0033FC64A0
MDMLHSPARTRAFGAWLAGLHGTVVNILRNETLALIEVDGELNELASIARRWPIQWDDLLVYTVKPGPLEPSDGFRLGLSGAGREAVQHAVRLDTKLSLCLEPVSPLPICDWSMPFSPIAARACPTCVRLAAMTP